MKYIALVKFDISRRTATDICRCFLLLSSDLLANIKRHMPTQVDYGTIESFEIEVASSSNTPKGKYVLSHLLSLTFSQNPSNTVSATLSHTRTLCVSYTRFTYTQLRSLHDLVLDKFPHA